MHPKLTLLQFPIIYYYTYIDRKYSTILYKHSKNINSSGNEETQFKSSIHHLLMKWVFEQNSIL